MNNKHDVFISYSSKDKRIADEICSFLEQHSISCWVAPRDVSPGVPYAREIIGGIRNCGVMVLVYTRNANISQHVVNEIDQAFNDGKTIIPFLVDDTPMNEELKYYLSRKHWLVAYPYNAEKLRSLATAVSNVLGKPFVPDNSQPRNNDEGTIGASRDNEDIAQSTDSSQRKSVGRKEWWEEYNMTPVSTFKLKQSPLYYITWFCLIACFYFFIISFIVFIDDQVWKRYNWYAYLFRFVPSILFFCFFLFYLKKYYNVNVIRKQRRQLLDSDFIEKHESRRVHYAIVARGTAQSHLFGVFDVRSVKMIFPFDYSELKWTEKGKLLSAVKDGQNFVIDVHGNRFQ